MKRSIFTNAFCALLVCLSFASNIPAQTLGWGNSTAARLGFSTQFDVIPLPQAAPALPDATAIDGGEDATFFLRANGTIASAGSYSDGVLGIGSYSVPASLPAQVVNLNDVVQVSGGWCHAMALRADGTVWSWGCNWFLQLGVGFYEFPDGRRSSPTPVQSVVSNIVQISAGNFHSLALSADGSVWAWGDNRMRQAGDEDWTNNINFPRKVGARVPLFKNLIAVAAGADFSLALKEDGTVWVWGGGIGLRGDGTTSGLPSGKPFQVPNLTGIVRISAGYEHILALKRDGSVYAWGRNFYGQAGYGQGSDYRNGFKLTSRATDVYIPNKINITGVVEIKAAGFHSLVRKRDGSVWAWGNIHQGQLGDGSLANNSVYYAIPYPVQSLAGTGNAYIGEAARSSFAGKPSIQTPAGFGVKHYGENVQMLFLNVTGAGTTAYTAIDPASVNLNLPAGYAIQPNEPAYNITTTAATSGEIEVCIKANEYDGGEFSLLKILHAEGANWVDRTYSSDFTRRRICARADSLSSFAIAKIAAPMSKAEVENK